jgi:folate-dependent tRNA-U54 methylase TrmFO/GidA
VEDVMKKIKKLKWEDDERGTEATSHDRLLFYQIVAPFANFKGFNFEVTWPQDYAAQEERQAYETALGVPEETFDQTFPTIKEAKAFIEEFDRKRQEALNDEQTH